MYELTNIFDVFLPQLLQYPNASDPLNIEAANLLIKNEDAYKEKVREYVKNYAGDLHSHILKSTEEIKSETNQGDSKNSSDKQIHKISTDIEDSDEMDQECLSNMSQLSDLSATSGIAYEMDI